MPLLYPRCRALGALVLLLASVVADAQTTPPDPVPSGNAAASAPMTRQQRKELLDSVDTMTAFVSADTALPIHQRVKRKLISRDEVARYLHRKLDDESTKRLERSEVVLKKFGLLDRSFDLQPFLVSLLTEQIAGFYDSKSKIVNLLDWVPAGEQKPVLAHELTHALQDQDVALEKWGDSGVHGVAKDLDEDRRHLKTDELETAREAVTEGQAMVVFYDDAMRSSGRTLADIPDLGQLLDADSDDKSSPVMERAPLLLKESLLFPYVDGLIFEHAVLRSRGKQGAFAGVLAHPPSSSFEILHPSAYLANAVVPSLPLPNLHPLLDPDYEPYDLGIMGELDVRILAQLLGGKSSAAKLAPAWDGGLYYAAQRRSATPAEKRTTGSIALLYQSRWRTAEAAHSFAALYALGLHHKYASITRRSADELSSYEQIYTTPEGDAVLFVDGPAVLVTEGLPLPLARQLHVLFGQTLLNGPQMQASEPGPQLTEPSLSLSHALLGFATPSQSSLARPAHYTSN